MSLKQRPENNITLGVKSNIRLREMEMLKRFQPSWAKFFGLAVYSRGTKNGGETFALADEREGFPTFFLVNLPIGTIRRYLADVRIGRRIIRRAHERGLILEEADRPSIGHLPDDLAFARNLGAFCQGERGASRPQVTLRKMGPRRW